MIMNQFSSEKYFIGYQNKRDVNQNWNRIKEFITNATNNFVPSKTTPNKKHLPEVSKQIRAKIRRKSKFHKLTWKPYIVR